MLHFSCDLCGTPLHDERHVVKMEIYPATEPRELTEEEAQTALKVWTDTQAFKSTGSRGALKP